VSSGAAGALDYAAISDHEWFEWSIAQQPLSIAYEELFPEVVAATLWPQMGHKTGGVLFG